MTEETETWATWPQWSRKDDRGLARYATPLAGRLLPLPVNRFDLSQEAGWQAKVIRAIYDALKERSIRYALEQYHPSQALQTIRTPQEILIKPREATCLDLSLLFCGLCLAYELLPILVVIEGHALAAVSLTHGLRDWNGYRPGGDLFAEEPVNDAQALRNLIDAGDFLAIECTGFAQSAQLREMPGPPEMQHRTDGVLSFDQALATGREQLERQDNPFRFALDLAIAHYGWRIEPYALDSSPGAWVTNIFRLLDKAPPLSSPAIKALDFEPLVAERTRHFVGREFVFRAIDDLLEDPKFDSGYILVRGEPGIGKTALVSQLVRTRGYVHHFNVGPQNIRSTRAFLENVCAQLIIRYQLDHNALPPEASQDSAYLSQLLLEAAQKVEGRPIVVLVDALDEAEDAGLTPSANRLFLPQSLPKSVFFVVTSREKMDYRLDVRNREDIYLRDDDPKNIADVRRYVLDFLESHRAEMRGALAAWKVSETELADQLTEKSQGNFMYLVHVLEDIRAGRISPETVESVARLPRGLREYYHRHWRTMRDLDQARFEAIYEPVLRFLATVREPVAVSALQEWSKVDPPRIRDVIREWRQFLNEETLPNQERRYRIYHASFQDFLAEEGMGLIPMHRRIAEVALSKVKGFAQSTLSQPGSR
ncbi:ATP-binding protein [Rhizobium ruizarguesonis]|uniref:ATP-binding protein n=1 Tax=Rhizobium ruizarguesonis TaxID=2081791 RepID=UPI0010327844|nr:AAA family ATPase [Rhizobium ruizarguesonis]TBA29348.1 ATP-binding protein [Rhizobium ruizarguesonis]TBA31371.1 ATP-binding protein [Rhizobium ruizarguesonis]